MSNSPIIQDSQHIPPGYKQTGIGVIPEAWEEKALYEGIRLLSGHHVLAQHCNTKGIGTPYITGPADFPGGVICHNKFTEKPTTICQKDDILVTVKGSGAGAIVLSNGQYCISRQLMAIRVTEWNTSYIHLSLRNDASLFGAAATGLIPGLSRGDILNKHIPIPPPAEQRGIAEALSDVDELLGTLDRLIAKKRDLKQAAMQQLLTGQTRLPGFHGEWQVKSLGEIATVKDGTHQTPKYVVSGVPFYSVEHVTSGDFENTKFISDAEHRFLTRTFKIAKGDILMTRIGSIGDCKLVDWDVNASFYVSLALLKMHQGYSAAFIEQYSKSASFQKEVELHSLQSAIPKKINLGPISNIRIEIPPLLEQTAIAEVLSDMDAELAALEQRREKTRALKKGMMQELLTGRIRLPFADDSTSNL